MSAKEDRRAGLLFGSFVAEAVALGVHWIYDPAEIVARVGRVKGCLAPGADSYHPHKQAGDQGHVGDQALWLAEHLVRDGRWNAETFFRDWTARWENYDDYVDKATKTTLQNLDSGKAWNAAASASDELAGPARSAPLIAFLSKSDDTTEDEVTRAAVEQSDLTHKSPAAQETATFLARAGVQLIQGSPLAEVLPATAPSWAMDAALACRDLEAVEAIGKLGQSCPIPAALPAVLFLCLKHGYDPELAMVENAMAGGDSCARALALGALLGAAHGRTGLNGEWVRELRAAPRLEALLNA